MSPAEREQVIEWCRECRQPADLILWGKLFPAAALGPRCLDCARQYMHTDDHMISQSAVFDLRKLAAAREEGRREGLKQGWDEGFGSGYALRQDEQDWAEWHTNPPQPNPNPYRKAGTE